MTKSKLATAILLSIASVALLASSIWVLYSGFLAFGGAMLGLALVSAAAGVLGAVI